MKGSELGEITEAVKEVRHSPVLSPPSLSEPLMPTAGQIHNIKWLVKEFPSVSSTMTVARDILRGSDKSCHVPMIVLAEQQTAGIGTHGRPWISPPGNLYATYVVPEQFVHCHVIPIFPLMVGLSVRTAILQATNNAEGFCFKWPNDVVFKGKKVSGCIIEQCEDNYLIGVGVNIATVPEITDGGRSATCINEAAPEFKNIVPRRLAAAISDTIRQHLRESASPSWDRQGLVTEYASFIDWKLHLFRREADGGRGEELEALHLNEWGHLVARGVESGKRETISATYLY